MNPVEVGPSKIQGNGVFAVSDIPAGDLIRRYNLVREITPSTPVIPERGELSEHCTSFEGRTFLVGDPDRRFNHSCAPNAFKRFRGGVVELVALREIAAGSEVTHDYLINTHGGTTWACGCGSERCRGSMPSSFFELSVQLQIEYLDLLADWFISQHLERVSALRSLARSPTTFFGPGVGS